MYTEMNYAALKAPLPEPRPVHDLPRTKRHPPPRRRVRLVRRVR